MSWSAKLIDFQKGKVMLHDHGARVQPAFVVSDPDPVVRTMCGVCAFQEGFLRQAMDEEPICPLTGKEQRQ